MDPFADKPFHGLTAEAVNFPPQVLALPSDLNFAEEDKEVTYLSPEECGNFIEATCGFADILLKDGIKKFRLENPNVRESDWVEKFKALKNVPNEAEAAEIRRRAQKGYRRQQTVKKRSRDTKKRHHEEDSQSEEDDEEYEPIISDSSRGIANIQSLFITLTEIRNVGNGILQESYYNEEESLKILPQLNGITIKELTDFYDTLFGTFKRNDFESERNWIRRYYSILGSIPAPKNNQRNVHRKGSKQDPNNDVTGLLVPYMYSYNSVQVNNDETTTGLHMDRLEGALLDLNCKGEGLERTGCLPGINSSMIFIGVAGATFPTHLEDGNAIDSTNYVVYGDPKFWCAIEDKYRMKVIERLQKVLREMREKKQLDPYLTAESKHQCILQHKQIILTPMFYDLDKTDPIPYKIFIQRENELMLIGAGVFHGGGNLGCNFARASNLVADDYHRTIITNFIQCTNHNKDKAKWNLIFSDQIIDELKKESERLFDLGIERKLKRKIIEAVSDAVKKLKISHDAEILKIVRTIGTAGEDERSNHNPIPSTSKTNNATKKRKLNDQPPSGTTNGQFKCKNCPKSFVQQKSLIEHEKNRTCYTDFKCLKCNKMFKCYSTYVQHETQCNATGSTITGGYDGKNYKCNNCQTTFSRIQSLNKHIERKICERKEVNPEESPQLTE